MDLRSIIDEIASQADDLLAGMTDRREARAGITELLNADYPKLTAADRKKVAESVMTILENEGFFESDRSGGCRSEPEHGPADQ